MSDALASDERSSILSDLLARVDEDAAADTATAFARLASEYLVDAAAGTGRVAPASVAFDPVAFEPSAAGAPIDDVVEALRRMVVADAIRLWHPMYMGHQVAPPLPAAAWTEQVIAALNQSLAVREMSPSATRIELGLVRWMGELVWGAAAKAAGGTFTSGGTEAIFTSLLAARNAALPEARSDGIARRAAIVCGEHAHYAVRRAASELGLGSRGAVTVGSRDHRMDVAELRRTLDRLVEQDVVIIAVVATAGSTATGSFDDLERIGELCRERGIWLHVDAAHGGGALLSARHRDRLAGIARADSVSWDPHKMMLMPLSAGVVLFRDARRLAAAFGEQAPYLFAALDDAGDRAVEQGQMSFMCSRRADALKVWVALERYGTTGIGALYDSACERARELHGLLEAHAEFEALHEPACNIVCFRWVGAPGATAGEAAGGRSLDAINGWLREAWNGAGDGWITTTLLDGRRVLRVVVMNPLTGSEHLERMVDGLAALARDAPFATPNPLP